MIYSIRESVIEFLSEQAMSQTFEPKLIAMVCTYCTYTAADMAGSLRLQYPHNVRIIKYLCTGKVDVQHMLKAFEGGADALLVGG
jgi:F420-non-reducing hydrogenase iron-sulfur subunit